MTKKIEDIENIMDYHKWAQTVMTAAITVMVAFLLNISIQDHERIANIDKRVAILEDRGNRINSENSKGLSPFFNKQYAILPKCFELPQKPQD